MIKLIALDLDDTLLSSDKRLSSANREALEECHRRGIEIVPCTGRIYTQIPPEADLDFIRYVIGINGAEVVEKQSGKHLADITIPSPRAADIVTYLDSQHAVYYLYSMDQCFMPSRLYPRLEEYLPSEIYVKILKNLAQPVKNFAEFVTTLPDVQKLILLTNSTAARDEWMEQCSRQFPDQRITSSSRYNMEINAPDANKGHGLKVLADYLGIDMRETAGFGDGLNDLSLIRDAGMGIAMQNAEEPLKRAADMVTLTNDEDGVAHAIFSALLANDD